MPKVTAVVENGRLRADAPPWLAEGDQVEIILPDPLAPGTAGETEAELRFWDEWFAETDPTPEETWDAFGRFLQENRVNFEERLDPVSLGLQHGVGPAPARSATPEEDPSSPQDE